MMDAGYVPNFHFRILCPSTFSVWQKKRDFHHTIFFFQAQIIQDLASGKNRIRKRDKENSRDDSCLSGLESNLIQTAGQGICTPGKQPGPGQMLQRLKQETTGVGGGFHPSKRGKISNKTKPSKGLDSDANYRNKVTSLKGKKINITIIYYRGQRLLTYGLNIIYIETHHLKIMTDLD